MEQPVEWLNYHHLLYFWMVAREGGLAPAAAKLRLAQSTLSGQIHALEESLGEKLFERKGRRLVLTEMGRLVHAYGDDIFALGRELLDTVHGRPTGRPLRLLVGIADALPKMVARRLLVPAQQLAEPVYMVCREDRPERLLGELATHTLDVVLADAPVPAGTGIRAYSHLLGECGVSFFAAGPAADRLRRRFPASLDGAPFLMPTEQSAMRRGLEQWFSAQGIRPRIVAEIEDSALLKAFGQDGVGAFAGQTVIEREIARQYRVRPIGRTTDLRERYYAITVDRRIKHPAVVAITTTAREGLFGRG
jgi:LysR family transcriptional regulator, transcriptional activator of nhaA